jgi:hypothetical protein
LCRLNSFRFGGFLRPGEVQLARSSVVTFSGSHTRIFLHWPFCPYAENPSELNSLRLPFFVGEVRGIHFGGFSRPGKVGARVETGCNTGWPETRFRRDLSVETDRDEY